jgi:hypothetical protein
VLIADLVRARDVCDNALGAERSRGSPISTEALGDVDEQTQQAIEDWHYWVKRGYRFS